MAQKKKAKAKKKTTKKRTTRKASPRKKKAVVDKAPPFDYVPEFIDNPAQLRRKLQLFWGMTLGMLNEILGDKNTPVHDVILIKMIRRLIYDNEIPQFIMFLNLLFKGGQVPGLDFEDDGGEVKRGQVTVVLPANGSENLDYFSPKNIVKGVFDEK